MSETDRYTPKKVVRCGVHVEQSRLVPMWDDSLVNVSVTVDVSVLPRSAAEIAALFASFPPDAQTHADDEHGWYIEIRWTEPATEEDLADHRRWLDAESAAAAERAAFEAWRQAGMPS